jgi:hypothetical protein
MQIRRCSPRELFGVNPRLLASHCYLRWRYTMEWTPMLLPVPKPGTTRGFRQEWWTKVWTPSVCISWSIRNYSGATAYPAPTGLRTQAQVWPPRRPTLGEQGSQPSLPQRGCVHGAKTQPRWGREMHLSCNLSSHVNTRPKVEGSMTPSGAAPRCYCRWLGYISSIGRPGCRT